MFSSSQHTHTHTHTHTAPNWLNTTFDQNNSVQISIITIILVKLLQVYLPLYWLLHWPKIWETGHHFIYMNLTFLKFSSWDTQESL
jgi:hypothetical protein